MPAGIAYTATRILFLGANGFIGSRIVARLLADGHRVCAAVRDPERLARRFPEIAAIRADLNRMTRPEDWRPGTPPPACCW